MTSEKFKVGDFEIEVIVRYAGVDDMYNDSFNVSFSARYENMICKTDSMRDVRDFIKKTIYETAMQKALEDKETSEAKRIAEELKKMIQE